MATADQIALARKIGVSMIAAHKRMRDGHGYIYVAAVPDTDAVKIGFSMRPERRVERLGYRLLGAFPASIMTERRFHMLCGHLRQPPDLGREIYPRAAFRQDAA